MVTDNQEKENRKKTHKEGKTKSKNQDQVKYYGKKRRIKQFFIGRNIQHATISSG